MSQALIPGNCGVSYGTTVLNRDDSTVAGSTVADLRDFDGKSDVESQGYAPIPEEPNQNNSMSCCQKFWQCGDSTKENLFQFYWVGHQRPCCSISKAWIIYLILIVGICCFVGGIIGDIKYGNDNVSVLFMFMIVGGSGIILFYLLMVFIYIHKNFRCCCEMK